MRVSDNMIPVVCAVCGPLGECPSVYEASDLLEKHFKEKHTDPITGKASGTIIDTNPKKPLIWRVGD